MMRNGKLRILHAIPHLSGGGAEGQMSYLVRKLVRMGHEVHIACLTEGPGGCELGLPESHLHRLDRSSNYDPRILWQLVRLIQRINPHVLQTWIRQMDVLGGLAARVTRTPWILGEQSSGKGYLPHWKNRLRTWVGSGAAMIASNSAGGDEYWQSKCPNTPRRIIPCGVPLDELEKAEKRSSPEIGVSENQELMLYVGRQVPLKNLRFLLAALAEARKRAPLVGVLCGDGPQRPELEKYAEELRIADEVRFLGRRPRSEVLGLLKRANVFVFLSAYEGCPNAVIEAMACGCSLVVSDIPAHREFLDEECAVFVDPQDIRQVSNAILDCLTDAEGALQRAKKAKAKIAQWSVRAMARQYEAAYERVTQGSKLDNSICPRLRKPHLELSLPKGASMPTRETRSRFRIRLDALQRLIMWHCFSGITPHYLVTEYPKSGGTWLAQMLAAYFDVPFPRNKRPPALKRQTCVLHGHYLYNPRFKNITCLVRDGRDVMVSAYYHLLFHNDRNPPGLVEQSRRKMPFDDYNDIRRNMPVFIEYVFARRVRLARFTWCEFVLSWIDKNANLVMYEDMLGDTPGTLSKVIKNIAQTVPDMDRLGAIARQFSFKNLTKRRPGEEDCRSFLRKGIAGDWKEKFTKEAREVFDLYAGDVLIQAGYEKDRSWIDETRASAVSRKIPKSCEPSTPANLLTRLHDGL